MRVRWMISGFGAAALAAMFALAAPAARADDEATAKLFKAQCSSCHGPDGKGQTATGKKLQIHDWTDGKTLKELKDDQMVTMIKEGKKGDDGKPRMPAFKKLTDQQITDLIPFVRKFDAAK